MSTPVAVARVERATKLTPPQKIMIAALVGRVLGAVYVQAILHTVIPPLAGISLLTLVVAAMCATRWRWAPFLTAGWALLSFVPGIAPYINNLTHPAVHGVFNETVVGEILLPFVVVVTGIVATLRRSRGADAGVVPHWYPTFLAGVCTLAIGAMLVAAIPQSAAGTAVSPAVLAGLPGLATASHQFTQREITAKVGQTVALRLDNSDAQAHAFDVDEFGVHVEMPGGKAALALFTPTKAGTYTFYCSAPGHANKLAGTGMVGKLIVTP